MSGPRIVAFGETMALFRAAEVGSLATESAFTLSIGGADSNVAIGVTRLGVSATWVGRVGRDPLGDRIIRELRAEGIDVRATVDPAAATGLMVKERRTSTATRVLYYRSASAGSRLEASDIAAAGIDTASLLHVTGITPALSESAAQATIAAIADATAAGIPVSFDVNHRATLWKDRDPSSVYRDIAGRSTVFFGGEAEARMLAPTATTIEQLAAAIAELGPTQVIIKLGDEGCYALIDGVEYRQSALRIHVVDTVGAGDAFVAGYLAELVLGEAPGARLATAVATGAFACLNPGDWEGYATRDDLLTLGADDPVSR
ncbi:sugar kinase [soil metagenome]